MFVTEEFNTSMYIADNVKKNLHFKMSEVVETNAWCLSTSDPTNNPVLSPKQRAE